MFKERVFYLSSEARKNILFNDTVVFLLLLGLALILYFFLGSLDDRGLWVLFFSPVFLFIFYKIYVFSKRNKAIIICKGKIYSWRSGWFTDREIKKAYIANFGKSRCIMFDLSFGLYEPTVYSDWSLYNLPSTMVVLCQGDCENSLESVLIEINEAICSSFGGEKFCFSGFKAA